MDLPIAKPASQTCPTVSLILPVPAVLLPVTNHLWLDTLVSAPELRGRMAATSQGADLVSRDAAVAAGEGAGRKTASVLIKTLRNTGLVDTHKVGKSGKY